MRPLPVHGRGAGGNPANRFEHLEIEGLDEVQAEEDGPATRFLRDRSRSVITTNDSPDVGFRASLNPYRGCEHGCVYCLSGDARVLMGSGRTRRMRDLSPGEVVYGTERRGRYRRYVRTPVLDHWRVHRPAVRIELADGTSLVAGRNHRFLTLRGWKFVTGACQGRNRRPHLTTNDRLLGTGGFAGPAEQTPGYRRGLERMDFDAVLEDSVPLGRASTVRVRGGVREHLRFFHSVDPAIARKGDLEGRALKSDADLRVTAVEPLGVSVPLYDITTGTGDFVAEGVVSHNCYARPTHEYLGFSAGLDFESRILVKTDAPDLLRRELADPGWEPTPLALSGVTDPYQPAERELEVTRRCLEVLAEARHPVGVVTKSRLVARDRDLLGELARHDAARVAVSITTLDEELRRVLEPRAPTPERRLDAVRKLTGAGVPVGVMVAPVIPGLTDHEVPDLLEAAADAGARHASWVPLRLPHGVEELFVDWLEKHRPARKEKVLGRIRDIRDGRLNDPRFGSRMRGEGPLAESLADLFRLACRRHGLATGMPGLSTAAFRRPAVDGQQTELFGDA